MGAIKHGMHKKKIYRLWGYIKERCYNPNHKSYHHYGGRGIKMCDEWFNNSKSFIDWALASGYKEGLTLDRIDVNGNYEPSNCRWVTNLEQQRNKRNNRFIVIEGERKTISEWAEISGIGKATIRYRLNTGVTGLDLLKPVKVETIEINGVSKKISEWSKVCGVSSGSIRRRIKNGVTGEDIIYPKRKVRNKTNCLFIEIDSKKYTIPELSKLYGLSQSFLYKRYYSGLTGIDLVAPIEERLIEINGESKTMQEWSNIYNININTLEGRFRNGVRGEDLIVPIKKPKLINIEGEEKTIKEWANQYNLKADTIYCRLKAGKTGKDLIKPSKNNRNKSKE